MIIFVDKNLFSDEKNNIVVNYEMIDGLLKEFNLKLDRYLIIQLIFKGLINKDNKDAIAINDIRVSKYYDILKDDYKIDYSSKMEKFINCFN